MYQNVNKLIEILYCEKYKLSLYTNIAQAQFIEAEMHHRIHTLQSFSFQLVHTSKESTIPYKNSKKLVIKHFLQKSRESRDDKAIKSTEQGLTTKLQKSTERRIL